MQFAVIWRYIVLLSYVHTWQTKANQRIRWRWWVICGRSVWPNEWLPTHSLALVEVCHQGGKIRSWLAGVDKYVLGVQPWLPTLRLVPCTSFHISHSHMSCCVAACMMEWSNTVSLRLIDLYWEKELLWNQTHADYKSRLKRLDAWNEIAFFLFFADLFHQEWRMLHWK
jgi:hypothetical protein